MAVLMSCTTDELHALGRIVLDSRGQLSVPTELPH
jgi:hypothetical protein